MLSMEFSLIFVWNFWNSNAFLEVKMEFLGRKWNLKTFFLTKELSSPQDCRGAHLQ